MFIFGVCFVLNLGIFPENGVNRADKCNRRELNLTVCWRSIWLQRRRPSYRSSLIYSSLFWTSLKFHHQHYILLTFRLLFIGWKRYPRWPYDFRWSYAGPLSHYYCVRILEPSDPHTWGDNYFCSAGDKKNPGMRWSYSGQIFGLYCIQILEASDPHTWSDNFLCFPKSTPLNLQWSSAGPISGKACIRWHEASDPHTWGDNYLCGKFQFMARVSILKNIKICYLSNYKTSVYELIYIATFIIM